MKQLWLRLDPSIPIEQKHELLKAAQGRCTVAMLDQQDLPLVSNLKLRTAARDGDSEIKLFSSDELLDKQVPKEAAVEITVKDSAAEKIALQLAGKGVRYLIVRCPDWKIIPLENLIAQTRGKAEVIADTSDQSEAKIALQTLELGVDGVVIAPQTSTEIEEMERLVKQIEEPVVLNKVKVVSVKPIGLGTRVCVDTCELMDPGEGMLVGSQSAGLFLVEAEVHRNPHVDPRPFRVNAGPVSSYVLTPGHRTRYLSELKAGDEVLIANRNGVVRTGHVGRVKIERRPMMVIQTESSGHSFSLIVQNAETVRLMSDGSSKSVSELKPDDEVLVRIESGGRHFGTLVADEMVIER
ncbi:MAG: 3-dehydroquinate synthase II [Candidatus Bathyarchaeia archaeon]|jgi:3-dehydroquinate synthase II